MASFGRFLAFLLKTRPGLLVRNFTGQIRNQDYQIDQKKFVPLITSEMDTSLTLPLVYMCVFNLMAQAICEGKYRKHNQGNTHRQNVHST